jgi:adenylate kinase family enzyme
MKRILVTGNAGSGKSTLASLIANQLNIPCHSLDRVVWKSGWEKTPADEKNRRILDLTKHEYWVIDGVSSIALLNADIVIFLDVPRRISYWRVCRRNWKYLFRSRPELPDGCPEILIIPRLCKIIWNFPKKIKPLILDHKDDSARTQRFFHLKTKKDYHYCLQNLTDNMSE